MRLSHAVFILCAVIALLLVDGLVHRAWSDRWVPNLNTSLSVGRAHVNHSSAELIAVSARSMFSSSISLSGRYIEPVSLLGQKAREEAFARSASVAMGLRLDVFRLIPYIDLGLGGRWQDGRGQPSLEAGLDVGLSYLLGQSWSADAMGRVSIFNDMYGVLKVNYVYLFSLEYRFTFGDSFDEF